MNIPDKRYVPDNRQNNNKKSGSGSGVLGLILVAVFLLSSRAEIGEMPAAFIALIALAVGFVVFAAIKSAKTNASKTTAARTTARPTAARNAQNRTAGRGTQRAAAEKAEEAEEAVHCHHSTGKQKYLEQLDGFLANGIIDKAEYKLMKERYNRLNIEDDYH